MTTAHGSITERHIAVVTITDGSAVGRGEASTLPGFGLETQADAVSALHVWAEGGDRSPHTTATHPGDHESAPRRSAEQANRSPDTSAAHSGKHESAPQSSAEAGDALGLPSAAGAIAAAVSGLDAARSGLCLAEHLSGRRPHPTVPTQAVIGDGSVDETLAAVTRAIGRGFTTLKIKVAARDTRGDLERISATRSMTGDGIRIRLDANGGWDVETAAATLAAMHHFDIDYVEEPTPDPHEFGWLAQKTGVDVALDEHASDPNAIDALGQTGGVSAVVVKPAILGGPAAAYELAMALLWREVRIIISSFMDGPVGLEMAIQLAAALPTDEVHGLGTAEMFVAGFPATQIPVDGHVKAAGVAPVRPSR